MTTSQALLFFRVQSEGYFFYFLQTTYMTLYDPRFRGGLGAHWAGGGSVRQPSFSRLSLGPGANQATPLHSCGVESDARPCPPTLSRPLCPPPSIPATSRILVARWTFDVTTTVQNWYTQPVASVGPAPRPEQGLESKQSVRNVRHVSSPREIAKAHCIEYIIFNQFQ